MLVAGLALAGCAGLNGVQEQVSEKDVAVTSCPSPDQLTNFASADVSKRNGLAPADYRNAVIGACITAANQKFTEYTSHLRWESTGTDLGVGLSVLTLAGLGAVGNGAKNAAAATQGLLGAGALINKDVFYDKTLPAIISAMNINRNLVLQKISKGLRESAEDYTLNDAGQDFWTLQNASNIDSAIAQMTNVTKQTEDSLATNIELPPIHFTPVDNSTLARRNAVLAKIDAIHAAQNWATLDQLATALSVAIIANKDVEYGQIKGKVLAIATGPTGMDGLATTVQPVLGAV